MDHRLISLLVCPVCKGPLELLRDAEMRPLELACHADRVAFPIRDGMPVMVEQEARQYDPDEPQPAGPATVPRD